MVRTAHVGEEVPTFGGTTFAGRGRIAATEIDAVLGSRLASGSLTVPTPPRIT